MANSHNAQGFLLHSRPFRESSVIATFITDVEGKLDLVVRSVRSKQSKKSSKQMLPFCLYEMSWAGKGDLKTLQFFEPVNAAAVLTGTHLYCGLYLNELLYYLLPKTDAEPALLRAYATAIQQLALQVLPEPVLRTFEIALLASLGYGIDFLHDQHGEALRPDASYRYVPECGLVIEAQPGLPGVGAGHEFLAIAAGDFQSPAVCRLAKVTLRSALAVYLGGRRLRSRELFVQ